MVPMPLAALRLHTPPHRRRRRLAWLLALAMGGASMAPAMAADRWAHRLEAPGLGRDAGAGAATGAAPLPAGVRVLHDQAYGPGARQRYDVYLPPGSAAGAPVLLMVHGGGWRYGDKAHAPVLGHKLAHWVAGAGVVFVSVNYGLLPDTPVAAQWDDLTRAVVAIQRDAVRWGGDPARMVVMGHSAGAHLVALLAARPDRLAVLGALPLRGAVALDSAAMDVPRAMRAPHLPLYDAAFGTDATVWQALSPWHQWQASAPPLLAVCSRPRRVACDQAERLAARARALGTVVEVLPQDLNHGDINARLGEPGAYTDAVDTFLRRLPHWRGG